MPTAQEAKAFIDQYRSDQLAHHGVLGQKWGHKKAVAPSGSGHQSTPRAPSAYASVLLGAYGNKKRYTNAEALKQRTTAGKLRTAAILTGVGSLTARKVANKTSGKVQAGAKIVSNLLAGTAVGLSVGTYVNGNHAVSKELTARKN